MLGRFAGFGNVLPFLFLALEALTVPRGCISWRPPRGTSVQDPGWNGLVLKVTVAKNSDTTLLFKGVFKFGSRAV